jgi:hypothetical protein
MKLVITTQVRENYGDASAPHWKNKGGEVYVVPNLTDKQILKIEESGIPTLSNLIGTCNSGYEEFILGWSIVSDDTAVCDEWETPYELFFEQGKWVARRTIMNDEYGYMRQEVKSKSEQYDMLNGGGRTNYKVSYVMTDGREVTPADLKLELA